LQKIFLFYWPWGCRLLRTIRQIVKFLHFSTFKFNLQYLLSLTCHIFQEMHFIA
jgi:hypothetical protein